MEVGPMRLFIIVFLVAVAVTRIDLAVIAILSVYLYTVYVDRKFWDKFWSWLTGPMTKKVEKKEKPEDSRGLGFTTYEEQVEKNLRGMLKPGFQDDPEWQRQTAEIRKIMDENRRINEAELRKEDEERARTATK
jgi:hypothetical protein